MYEAKLVRCKSCGQKNVDVRNLGFVNSEWLYKGSLKTSLTTVQGEGKTFDEKMHTFKETDLNSVFISLEVAVSKLLPKIINYDEYLLTTEIVNDEEEEEDQNRLDDVEDVDEFSIQTSRVNQSHLNQCQKNIVRK